MKHTPKVILTALLLAAPHFSTLHAADTPKQKPNIIFIMADQWRKQALGLMNEDKVSTPNLDRFAQQGALFSHAISTVPVCSPNRATMLTGKYPLNHGMLCNDLWLMPQQQTLGEISKANGYQTAYIGKWHLGQTMKKTPRADKGYVPKEFRHGFDFWFQEEGHLHFASPYFIGNSTIANIKEEWSPDTLIDAANDFFGQRDKDKPFSMVVSFSPPHNGFGKGFEERYMPGKAPKSGGGYAAPEKYEAPYVAGGEYYKRPVRANVKEVQNYEESKCVQGYFGAISAIDDAIGRLLKRLEQEGIADNTIILFTADHGETLGSHGLMTKNFWYQESAGIPLIIRYPGKIQPMKIPKVINSIDFLPTLLGLSRQTIPPGIDGVDFSPLLRGEEMKVPEYAFGSYYRGSIVDKEPRHFRAVYNDRYTYVLTHGLYHRVAGAPELLYDRKVDPYEQNPIVRGQGRDDLMDKFKGALEEHLAKMNDPFMDKVWAGGPNAAKPDVSHFENIIQKTQSETGVFN